MYFDAVRPSIDDFHDLQQPWKKSLVGLVDKRFRRRLLRTGQILTDMT